MKIGHGYDVHRFGSIKPLMIGGVMIPSETGLIAHSDGDVLCHALCDSLLGAAGCRDIGNLFPDNDDRYKDCSGEFLLKSVCEIINNEGYNVNCVDITIVAEKPKMAKFIPEMIDFLAKTMNINKKRVNVKATTEEGLGIAGKGIACHAVCLLDEEDV